ncbi:reverse transcriptase domain-containing protein [Candidatus Poriferisodalis sp.]|uniref:reverse transcriptase domain-containing protein n=1 Tax=Candidatus Poriferisodalis sp. TaxID=3101277 RepID=UPI003B0233CA
MRVEREIRQEAQRLIVRHETKGRLLAEENVRRARRTTNPSEPLRLLRPPQWSLHEGFDPYLTRARASRIAHSIRGRLASRQYEPRCPVLLPIPKDANEDRYVCVYQVADGAVSKMLFEGLLKKNLPIISARAYAYRKDVSAQNAIQYVKSEFAGRKRLFVAEYDFRRYFDMIDHEHIRKTLKAHFLLTEVERSAIEGFLRVAPRGQDNYALASAEIRDRGVPQGTSISLFLANVAAWNLDRELEQCGVGFVRYADDTLMWSKDYGRICHAVDILQEQAAAIGVDINSAKSPGIRLLADAEAHVEMEGTDCIDYLGYRLGLSGATMKESATSRIKKRISDLIYWNLIHEPANSTQNPARLSRNVDRDYVTLIWRIRRFLYGDLSEKAVRRYQQGDAPLRRFRGIMSAYPLIDDLAHLDELDNWILDQLYLAVRKRSSLLRAQGLGPRLPSPHGHSRNALRNLEVVGSTSGQTISLVVPSVQRIARIIRSATKQYGPSVVGKSDPYGRLPNAVYPLW